MKIFGGVRKWSQGIKISLLWRQVMVTIFFLGCFFGGSINFLTEHAILKFFGALGGFIGMCMGITLLIWALPLISKKKADERQKIRRNEVYTTAYFLVVSVVIIFGAATSVVLFFFSEHFSSFLLSYSEALARSYSFVVIPFFFYLPIAMLAWLEPDPLPNEPVVLTSTN